jgi:hypothetical protein
MAVGTFTGRIWVEAEVRGNGCWWRRYLAGRELCEESTQFECWRLRVKAIRVVKEHFMVLVLEVEERAVALRLP